VVLVCSVTARLGSSSVWHSRTFSFIKPPQKPQEMLKKISANSRQEVKTSWNLLISDLQVFTAWSLYARPTKRVGICSFHQKLVPFRRGFATVSLRVNQFLIVHIALEFSLAIFTDPPVDEPQIHCCQPVWTIVLCFVFFPDYIWWEFLQSLSGLICFQLTAS